MTTATELTPLLKRLKLGAMLNTLPERIALARREELDYASFLQVILTDGHIVPSQEALHDLGLSEGSTTSR